MLLAECPLLTSGTKELHWAALANKPNWTIALEIIMQTICGQRIINTATHLWAWVQAWRWQAGQGWLATRSRRLSRPGKELKFWLGVRWWWLPKQRLETFAINPVFKDLVSEKASRLASVEILASSHSGCNFQTQSLMSCLTRPDLPNITEWNTWQIESAMVGVGKLADCKKLSRTGAEDTKLTLNTCSLHLRSLCLCLCLIFLVFVSSFCLLMFQCLAVWRQKLASYPPQLHPCLKIDVDLNWQKRDCLWTKSPNIF